MTITNAGSWNREGIPWREPCELVHYVDSTKPECLICGAGWRFGLSLCKPDHTSVYLADREFKAWP